LAVGTPFSLKGCPSIRMRLEPMSSISTSPLPSGQGEMRLRTTSVPSGSTCLLPGASPSIANLSPTSAIFPSSVPACMRREMSLASKRSARRWLGSVASRTTTGRRPVWPTSSCFFSSSIRFSRLA